MEKQVFSVGELISLVNQTMEFAYPVVVVEGEVASFKVSKDKFVFFDLKDKDGVVGCFMMVYSLRTPVQDGMKVRVVAQPRLTAWGKFSLNVRSIQPVGEGSIKKSFELLKQKLQAEGLFEQARKRKLPVFPLTVGVVASVESAGYADFLKILNNRWHGLEVIVANVQVQGINASAQIIKALDFFNQQPKLADVLVVIRGGGSAEDLAVFNEELLVRAIASSRIPTLVGVGHETDTSLSDFAADVRAATPSNAAQLLVPDKKALKRDLEQSAKRLVAKADSVVAQKRQLAEVVVAKMLASTEQAHKFRANQLIMAKRFLNQVNPRTILNQGYALVRIAGKVLNGKTAVKTGDKLVIETGSLKINAGVEHVEKY